MWTRGIDRSMISRTIALLLYLCLLSGVSQGADECSANNDTIISINAKVFPGFDYLDVPRDGGGSPPNMTCAWNITGPPQHVIGVELYTTRWSDINNTCVQDEYLEIFDGSSSSSKSILKVCKDGSLSRPAYFTSGPNAWIQVKTSSNPNRTRITIRVMAFQQNTCLGGIVTNLTASTSLTKNFTSPFYNYRYPPNCSCAWRIAAPAGHVVKLQVKADLTQCLNNFRLEVYDSDQIVQKDLLKSFCYSYEEVTTFYSSGEAVFVFFSSKSAGVKSGQGFIIHYTAFMPASSCSPSNTAEQNQNIVIQGSNPGLLKSPHFPGKFPQNLDCIWKFRAPPGHVVQLYFDTINLDAESCLIDPYLKVRDGLYETNTILKSVVCRSYSRYNLIPSFSVASSGDRMRARFVTKSNQVKGYGFYANYTYVAVDSTGTCGEGRKGVIDMKGQASTIETQDFKAFVNKHPKNMTCLWNITVEPGYVIKLTIMTNCLSFGCDVEHARVYDGATLDSPTMVTLCNGNDPSPLYSTGNSILIELKTSSSEQRGQGFHVSYMALTKAPVPYACKHKTPISADILNKHFASMSYPLDYPNNAFCRWTFEAPFTKLAQVTITKLNLQESAKCTNDSVEVAGSDYLYSPILGTLCGKPKVPIIFTSSGRKLAVTFMSDWLGRYPGFEGKFDVLDDVLFGKCNVQGRDNLIPLNGSDGILSSPRYPKYFPKSMTCTWLITVPEGHFVDLLFKDFKLDYFCKNSFLEIRDGALATSKQLGKYCSSNNPTALFSSGRHLWVRFTSLDDVIINRGFNATYSAVNSLPYSMSCRQSSIQKIVSSSGQLASFNYPLEYRNSVVCRWSITVSDGQRVKFTFDSFDIEKTSGCKGDYVELHDGASRFSESLGRFCGDAIPEPVYSSGSTMYITFVSDKSGRKKGFKASFESSLSVRSIILIVVFSLMGFCALCSLIGWCLKVNYSGTPNYHSEPTPLDVAPSTAASNIELATSKV